MLRLGSSWQKWWNWRPLLLHGDSRLQLAVRNELDTSSARGNFHPGHGDGGFRGDRGRLAEVGMVSGTLVAGTHGWNGNGGGDQ